MAYEVRIIGWSADVCSSDLEDAGGRCWWNPNAVFIDNEHSGRHDDRIIPTYGDSDARTFRRRHRGQQRTGHRRQRAAAELPAQQRQRPAAPPAADRQTAVYGKGVSVGVDSRGRSIIQKINYTSLRISPKKEY